MSYFYFSLVLSCIFHIFLFFITRNKNIEYKSIQIEIIKENIVTKKKIIQELPISTKKESIVKKQKVKPSKKILPVKKNIVSSSAVLKKEIKSVAPILKKDTTEEKNQQIETQPIQKQESVVNNTIPPKISSVQENNNLSPNKIINNQPNWKGGISRRFTIKPKIEYPQYFRENGIEGKVKLLLRVDSTGNVIFVTVIKSTGYSQLDTLAKQALRASHFIPVSVTVLPNYDEAEFEVSFELKN